jgi:hypothetical protein
LFLPSLIAALNLFLSPPNLPQKPANFSAGAFANLVARPRKFALTINKNAARAGAKLIYLTP